MEQLYIKTQLKLTLIERLINEVCFCFINLYYDFTNSTKTEVFTRKGGVEWKSQ